MTVAKNNLSAVATVFAALIAGHAVAGGYGKGPYGAGCGSSAAYGMPYGNPYMAHPQWPQRPLPPARPQPPKPPQMGGAYRYGHPMRGAHGHGGYAKHGAYGSDRGYGKSTGQTAAPAAAPAEPAATSAPVEAVKTASVDISQMRFDAPTVTVKAGGTVTWTNRDGAPHTVTATDGSFGSSQLTSGDSFSHTFSEPGTYTYFCQVHPMMKATVVVKA